MAGLELGRDLGLAGKRVGKRINLPLESRAGTITLTIQHAERPHFLAWTGKTLGIHATHIWRIAVQDGRIIVRTEESWEGWMARIFRGPMQRMLKESIDNGLGYLKTEVEQRANQSY